MTEPTEEGFAILREFDPTAITMSRREGALCDEIQRLRAVVDRQQAALVVAGTECDAIGETDLHVVAFEVAVERGGTVATDRDYAEAYIRAVEALDAEGD